MLAILGFITVIVMLVLVMTKKSSPTVALIGVPVLLPVYDAVGMKRTTLACIAALSAGTMNIVPWGGPTIRAATAMEMNVMDLFSPVIPALICGLITVLIFAFFMGKTEKKQIGSAALTIVMLIVSLLTGAIRI